MADQFADTNLTPQQVGLLHCLSHHEGISQRDLSEAMVIDGATMTGLVSRLEKMDLISRKRDEVDRRLVMLYLTEQGRALVALTVERTKLVDQVFLERLGPQGVEDLCRLLKILLGWEGAESPAPPPRTLPKSSHTPSAQ